MARVLSGLVVVLAVLMTQLAAVAIPRAGALPTPDQDPFYTAPGDLAAYSNGSIIDYRPIRPLGLPLPVDGWQVKFRTTDAADRPAPGVATVLVPKQAWTGQGSRPLVSFQIAEDSLGSRCAPSYALAGGWGFGGVNTFIDVPFIAALLRRGWGVVTADYEGPDSRFLDGPNSGHGVLDGVRAALALAPGGVGAASPLGAWGYSGGAFATLWAAQLRGQYAPELRFAGVAAGGVPADWPATARSVDGTPQAGLAVVTLIATARNDPGNGVLELLNERGRAVLARESASCAGDLVLGHVNEHADDLALAPGLFSHPVFRAATASQELGAVAPDMPMYLYHSRTDDVIPVAGYTELVRRYCAQGASAAYRYSDLPGHNPTAVGEAFGAVAYLADRLAGEPVGPGCQGEPLG
ncbi:lipase [Nocardia panacis]|uniref:Lipase n=1 Tax=Nocardia panacis TaxID=2340916 RepID=A0A3A4KRS6_9NOCA|nr:lipase family protein [Nocardia panacis]RJO78827.1 lipase [Nocardia panacis]